MNRKVGNLGYFEEYGSRGRSTRREQGKEGTMRTEMVVKERWSVRESLREWEETQGYHEEYENRRKSERREQGN